MMFARMRSLKSWSVLALAVAGCTQSQINVSPHERQSLQRVTDSRIENAPESPAPQILPQTHFAAGKMFEAQGLPHKAIEQYQRAIAVNHSFIASYKRLGILLSKVGRHSEAVRIFTAAVEIEPGSAALRNNLGFELMHVSRWDDAESELRRAIALNPELSRAHVNLGMVLSRMGRFDEALTSFRRVLPEPDAYYNLALMYRGQKRYREAAETFAMVLTIDPEFTAAHEQLAEIAPHVAPREPIPVSQFERDSRSYGEPAYALGRDDRTPSVTPSVRTTAARHPWGDDTSDLDVSLVESETPRDIYAMTAAIDDDRDCEEDSVLLRPIDDEGDEAIARRYARALDGRGSDPFHDPSPPVEQRLSHQASNAPRHEPEIAELFAPEDAPQVSERKRLPLSLRRLLDRGTVEVADPFHVGYVRPAAAADDYPPTPIYGPSLADADPTDIPLRSSIDSLAKAGTMTPKQPATPFRPRTGDRSGAYRTPSAPQAHFAAPIPPGPGEASTEEIQLNIVRNDINCLEERFDEPILDPVRDAELVATSYPEEMGEEQIASEWSPAPRMPFRGSRSASTSRRSATLVSSPANAGWYRSGDGRATWMTREFGELEDLIIEAVDNARCLDEKSAIDSDWPARSRLRSMYDQVSPVGGSEMPNF